MKGINMNKYKEVNQSIKELIKNEEIKPGNYLKKEADLANDYSCSVLTVRKALSMLENEGYIQKIKGKRVICFRERGFEKYFPNINTDFSGT